MIRLLLLCAATAGAADNVLLVSVDGLGYRNLTSSAAGRELTTLHALTIQPMRTAYPSKTSAGHAALFTGTWSGTNGIVSNTVPLTPRADHTVKETVSGFRSTALTADPIWVTAARQGIRTVAYQVTQAYPFSERSAGLSLPHPPVVLNGYQTEQFVPYRVVRQRDLEQSGRATFLWKDGPLEFRIRRTARGLRLSAQGHTVTVVAQAPESASPRGRPLARYFSRPLPLVIKGKRTAVFFRLIEFDDAGFTLLHTSAHELAVSGLGRPIPGVFVGNSAISVYEKGALGKLLVNGGDGSAERLMLETIELSVRETTAQMVWLQRTVKPRLFVGYYSVIDDTEHAWYGLSSAGNTVIDGFRAHAYAALDEGLKQLSAPYARSAQFFSADHGMAAAAREIHMGALLAELGYDKTQVVPNASCLYLNTTDWKNGTITLGQRAQVLDALRARLAAHPVVTRVYGEADLRVRFGLDGPTSPDLCFDVAPLHYPSETADPPVVREFAYPRGEHGFDPTREDMWSYLASSLARPAQMGTLVDIARAVLARLH